MLVRLRPAALALSPQALGQIARLATRYGNGIVEITARGNLQLRGLTQDTVPGLGVALDEAGIALATGLAIEIPPLSDVDTLADPRPFADALRSALSERQPGLMLAPKLAVILDGGGRFHLCDQSADVRARAIVHKGEIVWELGAGGTQNSATRLAAIDGQNLVGALLIVLTALHDLGPRARGRDLDCDALTEQLAGLSRGDVPPCPRQSSSPVAIGLHTLKQGQTVLGLRPAFGQIGGDVLASFADGLALHHDANVRLCPDHGLLVTGLSAQACADLRGIAAGSGFHVDAKDPALRIAACAGRGACRSGLIDTKDSAQVMMRAAPGLFDGSLSVHLSGCVKGCARPSAAVLTLVGSSYGTTLVVNGPAGGDPVAYFEEKATGSALRCLQQLVVEQKHAGESVQSCLTRLGREAIATAIQQG